MATEAFPLRHLDVKGGTEKQFQEDFISSRKGDLKENLPNLYFQHFIIEFTLGLNALHTYGIQSAQQSKGKGLSSFYK